MFGSKKQDTPSRRTNFIRNKEVPTYSYHNVRNDQEGVKGRNIKKIGAVHLKSARKLWAEKFGLIVLAIVVVVCLANVLYLSSKSAVILGGYSTNPIFIENRKSVEETADKLLSSSILNSNKITVNISKIQSTLEADYPLYSNVSITLPFIDHHPVIYLTPAQATLVLNNSTEQYLVNDNGQIMLEGQTSTSFDYLELPQINYRSSGLKSGDKVLTTDEVQFIQVVVYELSLKGNKVSSMTLPQGTSELNVYLIGEPYYVKFNLYDNDPRQQAGSFLATQNYLKSQNITPSSYIDVRTDGRVYYQ